MIVGALMGIAFGGLFGPKSRVRGFVIGVSVLLLVGVGAIVATVGRGGGPYAGLAAVSFAFFGFAALLLWGAGFAGGTLVAKLLHV
jgi:hypothetical protein